MIRTRTRPVLTAAVLAVALAGLAGCGSSNVAVKGTVKFDGKPIDDGTITFVPETEDGRKFASTVIKDGSYAFDSKNGPAAGKYKVQFTWNRKTGAKVPDGDNGMRDETVQALPEKYNKSTTYTAEVKSSSEPINFDLTK